MLWDDIAVVDTCDMYMSRFDDFTEIFDHLVRYPKISISFIVDNSNDEKSRICGYVLVVNIRSKPAFRPCITVCNSRLSSWKLCNRDVICRW
jgi:hypothetical protein